MTSDGDLESLAAELQRLRDIEEIKQMRGRYCRLIDSKQFQAWGELLTEDFHAVTEGGVQDGRDVAVAFLSKSLAEATTVHHCHTPEITFTGEGTATGIWAMQDHVRLSIDGSPVAFRGAGHYHDVYVRNPDGWRVKSTELRRLSVDMLEGKFPSRPGS
jgi:hypothetical protein